MSYVPERGDIVWITFDPQAGHEQAGRRPAVILSPSSYNGRVKLAILCPITSQVKGYTFEVPVPPGLRITGVILADQVRNFDWYVRQAEFIDKLPAETLRRVAVRLRRLLPSDVLPNENTAD